MMVEGVNVETGKTVQLNSDLLNDDVIFSLAKIELTETQLKRKIDNLSVSADLKSLIFSIAKTTIKVGNRIVKLGAKLLEYVFQLFQQHPETTFGMIFGAIIGVLVWSIPFLGVVLGPLVTPVAIAFGMIKGAQIDINNAELKNKIEKVNSEFKAFEA
ncbi:MAG: hypothetical protein HQL49_13600 [Gammaproteobacteria bacterium]|nr:hypothetical protein [Gammaproteobacteria bacterium]